MTKGTRLTTKRRPATMGEILVEEFLRPSHRRRSPSPVVTS